MAKLWARKLYNTRRDVQTQRVHFRKQKSFGNATHAALGVLGLTCGKTVTEFASTPDLLQTA